MDTKQDWKQLYEDTKRELDQRDQLLSELQKGLLKLSLGFFGRNPDFDKLLKIITRNIREGGRKNPALKRKLLVVISQVIKFTREDKSLSVDSRGGGSSSEPPNEISLESTKKLSDLIQKIPVDEYKRVEVELLTNKLENTNSDAVVSEVIDDVVTLLTDNFNFPENQITSDSSNEQLIELLEKISFDKKFLPRINKTKSVLANQTEIVVDQAPSDMVAELINKSILSKDNLDEVEVFLKKMTQRLESLHQHLGESELITSDQFTESSSFSQDLDEQFNELREDIESASSISAMKLNIESHLDYLNSSVSEHVKKEKERMMRAEETVGVLNSQLGVLQQETAVLKKSVEEEQVKSLTDALTSTANRRAYEERLELEIARWKRQGGHLSLMLFDLDKFKTINDNYGHVVGDKVLRGLTATFKREIRQTDFLARYGGEEFIILMPDTALSETMVLADKLRAEVEQCVFRYQGKEVPVTVSIGVAEYCEGDTGETLFGRADQALYLAKSLGRNICRSEEDLEPA